MSITMLESLMVMVQDEPQRLKSESEKLRAKILSQNSAFKTRVEAAERLGLLWKEYCEERKKTDERLALARLEYKDVLKRTESAALSGQPRLYWFAKSMFAKLRRHSLEYQVSEVAVKFAALEAAREKLLAMMRCMNIEDSRSLSSLFDTDFNDKITQEHSFQMAESFQGLQALQKEQVALQKKLLELEISLSNLAARVGDIVSVGKAAGNSIRPAVVDSDKMLTSRLPHVGFVNRPKLLALIDQCEYAAEHAERDLQKVREGLKFASEAAPGGRPSRTSRDWLDYCRAIVCRYNEQIEESSTPR